MLYLYVRAYKLHSSLEYIVMDYVVDSRKESLDCPFKKKHIPGSQTQTLKTLVIPEDSDRAILAQF